MQLPHIAAVVYYQRDSLQLLKTLQAATKLYRRSLTLQDLACATTLLHRPREAQRAVTHQQGSRLQQASRPA